MELMTMPTKTDIILQKSKFAASLGKGFGCAIVISSMVFSFVKIQLIMRAFAMFFFIWLVSLIVSAQDQDELVIVIDNAPVLYDTLNAHSVIGYLSKGTVVLKDFFIENPSDWIYVENGDDSVTLSGFVHKTWVVQLDTLPQYKEQTSDYASQLWLKTRLR